MSIKRITLATAILLSLTACGSGGSSSPAPSTNTQVQSQLETEIAQLKQQLAAAQQATSQAETNLKNATTLSVSEKAALEKELAEAKQQLATIQSQLEQANSTSSTSLAEIKKTLTQTQSDLANVTKQLKAETTAKITAQEQVKTLESQLVAAQKATAQAEANLKNATALSAAEKAKLESELATAKQNLANAEKATQEVEAKFQQSQNASVVTDLENAKKALAEAQTQVAEIQSQLTQAKDTASKKIATLTQQLEAKAQEAKDALANASLSATQKAVLQKQLDSVNAELSKLKNTNTANESALKEAQTKLTTAQAQVAEIQSQLTQAKDTASKEIAALTQQLEAKAQEAKDALANANLSATQKAVLQKQLDSVNAELSKLKNTNTANESALKEAQAKLATTQAQVAEIQSQLTQANQAKDTASKEITTLTQQLEAKAQEAKDSLANASLSATQKATLQKQLDSVNAELSTLKNTNTANESALKEAQTKLQSAETNLASITAQLEAKTTEANQLNQELTAQAKQAQAEIAKLNTDLKAAKTAQKNAETQLANAESLSASQIAQEQAKLAEAQKNIDTISAQLAQKEVDLAKVQEEKVKAETALLEVSTPLTKEQVYQLAINAALGKGWAEELAQDYQGKSKDEVQTAVILYTRISKVRTLARENFGFTDQEARAFEKANRDKSYEEILDLLNQDRQEKEKAQQELTASRISAAKQAGMSEYLAQNFVSQNSYLSNEEFETKVAKFGALITSATNAGLSETAANNYASSNIWLSESEAKQNLDNIVRQNKITEFTQLANEMSVSKYGYSDGLSRLIERNTNLTKEEFQALLQKLPALVARVQEVDSNYYFSIGNFAFDNVDKSEDEIQNAIIERVKYVPDFCKPNCTENTILTSDTSTYSTGNSKTTSVSKIYNQKYSIVNGTYAEHLSDSYGATPHKAFGVDVSGLPTLEKNLPVEGSATYTGKAFNYESEGDLTYNVDFADRKGSGKIEGIQNYGTITLEEGDIKSTAVTQKVGIEGKASSTLANESSGTYGLNFYGNNAEEVGGKVFFTFDYNKSPSIGSSTYSSEIGFGGTRGEIQK